MPNWYQNRQKRPQTDGDQDITDSRIDASKYADILIREILTSIGRSVEAGKSIGDSMMAYNLNVQNLETICYANDWIEDKNDIKYKELVNSYFAENKLDTSKHIDQIHEHRIHRKKFQFLLKEILQKQLKYLELEI